MSDSLSTAWALAWIRGAQAAMAEHRMELIDLDRAIGDGDHGANMDKGFTAVVAKLEGGADSIQDVLKVVAQTLMSTVGGVISGDCSIGSMVIDTTPHSVMMIAKTDAKTGRSMKNRDITVWPALIRPQVVWRRFFLPPVRD